MHDKNKICFLKQDDFHLHHHADSEAQLDYTMIIFSFSSEFISACTVEDRLIYPCLRNSHRKTIFFMLTVAMKYYCLTGI